MRRILETRPGFKRLNTALSRKDEETWADLKRSLREQYPNPQREGCPVEGVLRGLAFGKMRLDQAHVWLDHLGHCSQCFRDFERLQVEAARQRRQKWAFAAVAAVLVICSAAALWLKSEYESQSPGSSHQQSTRVTTVQTTPEQLATATLVFESPATTRSGDGGASLQRLPRSRVALSIYFPSLGGPGKCEVQFLRIRSDRIPLLKLEGYVKLDNHLPVLHVIADLSTLAPGTYVVRFRQSGSVWRYSRVVLS